MTLPTFQLRRNAFGRLEFQSADGDIHEGVIPVRAFPISEAGRGLSLVTGDGRELVWIEHLSDVPALQRALIEEELESREFMPEIRKLASVSTFATPSVWKVDTDRGPTSFTLRGEEDIRRLSAQTLLIADSHGIFYLVRDIQSLDKHSRKLLDRFL
ncbi:Domain of uncharacterised function (DUF1854) [Achromobacter denitrificans]|uniref:cyanophycin metabolism-associated DUF1854 family protein n=1 Tax=Achromobacter denitrificans TaxID=32002 RepID=UPI0007892729|nr:DUF1854 domain-containing protein [Achromobacter denitrificans]OLU09230.1 hypothetical protein BVK87_06275 [Achromobacter denitrificans]QKH45679.1 DUF1854 domain-containing protein [Achromobacter denitrificans]QKH52979.1 DUF1854 domain-containing protein [Achromobacter denitrificans]CAB3698408.1 hypothetical protein LMG1231_02457 [Achromobacter denitrificans]SUW33799.1 Domain of uncharacterised function (DUF1854) [Achromobacter denitrificans]